MSGTWGGGIFKGGVGGGRIRNGPSVSFGTNIPCDIRKKNTLLYLYINASKFNMKLFLQNRKKLS